MVSGRPSLLFGSFELFDPDGSAYGTKVLAQGTSKGNPIPITQAIESFLEHGAIEVTQGYQNRVVPIRVVFSGDDMDALTDAETDLFAEVGILNTLTWTPWDPQTGTSGTPVVFDVVNSHLEQDDTAPGADVREIQPQPQATYQLELTCASWVHAAESTTVPALPAPPPITTSATISDGSSAIGWTGSWTQLTGASGSGSATPAVSSGMVKSATPARGFGEMLVEEKLSGLTEDVSVSNHIVVDFVLGSVGTPGATYAFQKVRAVFNDNGVEVAPFALTSTGPLTYRAVFNVGALTTLTSLAIRAQTNWTRDTSMVPTATLQRTLAIDNVDRTSDNPTLSSARQQVRSFELKGSAPTIGSIAVEDETSALGDVLVYSYPDDGSGYRPDMRTYRTAGGTVDPDATTVSGGRETLATPAQFEVPNSALPDGECLLVARMKRSSAASQDITWTIEQFLNATSLDSPVAEVTSVPFGTAYQFHVLGTAHLPPLDAAIPATSKTRISIAGSSAVTFDELYVLNLTIGQVTMASLGTGAGASGGASRRLWIDSPSLANGGLGRYLRGHAADRSDAFSALPVMQFPGRHLFDPKQPVNVFTVASEPDTPVAVSFKYDAAGFARIRSDW